MAMLKRVSRSFYLSVKLLPRPMRRGVCIGYLLARAADTLADAQDDPALLDAFERAVDSDGSLVFRKAIPGTLGEQTLLANLPDVISALHDLPEDEVTLVREVVTTIISGQRLDMVRFLNADAQHVVALENEEALEDYTWRVAGCVGRFWTRLGFLTLGREFSKMPSEDLEHLGVMFGKGLQLVNILRDVREDLSLGRRYLPSERDDWILRARDQLGAGMAYATAMRFKRLHVAVALPARIGMDTLDLLEHVPGDAAAERVKIPRRQVWWHVVAAWKSSLSRGDV